MAGFKDDFGNALHYLRKNSGMTQTELAEKVGVTTATVSNWEKGLGGCSADNAAKIADLFEVSLDALFGRTGGK